MRTELSCVCQVIMGQSPASDTYNQECAGLPFFQGNADFGEHSPKIRVWCSAPLKKAEKGNILISVRAPIGAVNVADRPCCIGRGLAAISSKNESVLQTPYLYFYLLNQKENLEKQGTGSTFKAINKTILEKLKIRIIGLSEQQRRVSLLCRLKKILSLHKTQLEKLDELVKARFVEMLRQRSPRMVPISQIGTVFTGSTPAGDIRHHEGQEIPFAKPSDLCMDYPVNITWTQHCLPIEAKPYVRMYPAGAILVACIASIGKIGIAATSGTCNQQINAIIPNDNIDSYYLAYALHSIQSTIIQAANTAVVPILNKGSFEKICIPIVKEEIQRSFAAFVKEVDKSKVVVQKSLEKAQQLYDSLMQQYFD